MGAAAVTWKQECEACGWDVYPYCICAELREARSAVINECIAALQSLVERP